MREPAGASGSGGGGGTSGAGGADAATGGWTTTNGWTWRNANIQGMGYVTGLVVHPDVKNAPNTVYARTDVGGAYRYDAKTDGWVPLLDAGGTRSGWLGVESIAVDPSAPNDVYAATGGGVLRSTDRGATWTSIGLTNVHYGPNEPFRGSSGERLAVDPHKSGVLYFGSRRDGLWKKDGTAAWIKVSGGLPAASDPGFTFVLFDPKSPAMYTGATGSGVWMSTDAGASWTLNDATVNPLRAAISSDGTLYVSFGGDEGGKSGSVRKRAGSTWSDVSPRGTAVSYSGVSTHPSNPALVAVTTNSGDISVSSDHGATWTTHAPTYTSRPEYYWIPEWFRWGSAALVLDPNDASGKTAWRTDGFAISRSTDIASGKWTTVMTGVEELVAQVVKAPPVPGGAALISGVADAQGFVHARLDAVPSTVLDPKQPWVAQGSSIDYCQTHPENVAYVGWHQVYADRSLTGFSSDNGKTWKPFASVSPGRAGNIAMSATDPKNMVWSPVNEVAAVTVQVTKDGGATWQPVTGLPGDAFQRHNTWWTGQTLTSDRVDGSTFYYVYQNQAGTVGFYRSTDGGANWQKTAANLNIPEFTKWTVGMMLKANPFVRGDVWLSFAPGDGLALSGKLLHSTNGGDSFSVNPGFSAAFNVALGKGDATHPAYVYVFGRPTAASKSGVYQSTDAGATWTLIDDPNVLGFESMTHLEADSLVENRVYAATGGRGIFYAVKR